MSRVLSALILISCSIPAWGGPGLDIRPQVSANPNEAFQTLDLLLLQANDLTCESTPDGKGRCGGSFECQRFETPESCLNEGDRLGCNWSCE